MGGGPRHKLDVEGLLAWGSRGKGESGEGGNINGGCDGDKWQMKDGDGEGIVSLAKGPLME